MKNIHSRPPLEEAIKTLEDAVAKLDEMIKTMQESQATLRSWLEPGEKIGWMENGTTKK